MDEQGFAELQIEIRRDWSGGLAVDARLSQPGSEVESEFSDERLTAIDLNSLAELAADQMPGAYGKKLGESLLGDAKVGAIFAEANRLGSVRVRLEIDPDDADLHDQRWETLADSMSGNPLFLGDRLLFSRYLRSEDRRPVRLSSRNDIRALVVVADPEPSTEYQLSPIALEDLKRAAEALDPIPAPPLEGRATLANVMAHLRREPVDILYVVCHGWRGPSGPVIYLEDDAGNVAPVLGTLFARELAQLERPPGLVVLASCESAAPATTKDGTTVEAEPGAVAALGPLLVARAGVPAVLAMQGKVSQATAAAFMKAFFVEMRDHGQIDLATSRARAIVQQADDWWMPALFMRLRHGRLWYPPGFSKSEETHVWSTLWDSVTNERCTAILGPGLLESVTGPMRLLSLRWSEFLETPVPDAYQRDPVLVAQFLAVVHSESVARGELRRSVREAILDRFGDELPAEVTEGVSPRDATDRGRLLTLMAAAGEVAWRDVPEQPHRILAGLPIRFFLAATPDPLLERALEAMGKRPQVDVFNWRPGRMSSEEVDPGHPRSGRPYDKVTSEAPQLVYLLGSLAEQDSYALTENNYFDFLAAFSRSRPRARTVADKDIAPDPDNWDVVDPAVRRALTEDSLLFLGFRLDDWSFRVLLRSIVLLKTGRREELDRSSIAVQIVPDEGSLRSPEATRLYLENYFEKSGFDGEVKLYWGSTQDFVRDLRRFWIKREFDPSTWPAQDGSPT